MKTQLHQSVAAHEGMIFVLAFFGLIGISFGALLVGYWTQVRIVRSICRRENRPFSHFRMVNPLSPVQWHIMKGFYAEAVRLGLWHRWVGSIAGGMLVTVIAGGLIFIFGETVR